MSTTERWGEATPNAFFAQHKDIALHKHVDSPFTIMRTMFRKLQKAVAVSGIPNWERKLQENLGRIRLNLPESQHAVDRRISDTGKGKPTRTLGRQWPSQ